MTAFASIASLGYRSCEYLCHFQCFWLALVLELHWIASLGHGRVGLPMLSASMALSKSKGLWKEGTIKHLTPLTENQQALTLLSRNVEVMRVSWQEQLKVPNPSASMTLATKMIRRILPRQKLQIEALWFIFVPVFQTPLTTETYRRTRWQVGPATKLSTGLWFIAPSNQTLG